MRVLVPLKNSVVCKRINNKTEVQTVGSIQFTKQNVDLYEILDFSVDNPDEFHFRKGDIVMLCSTGDELEINENEVVYLFKSEHIMCKVG